LLSEPADVGEAGRTALCAGSEGAAFCLWQAKEQRGAAIVNEPGSLNFNDLDTRDIHRARLLRSGIRLGGPGPGRRLRLGAPRLRRLPRAAQPRDACGHGGVIADPQGATFTASKFVPENKSVAESGSATNSA
jgi:hypothetical protein